MMSEPLKEVCENCPFIVSIDVANNIVFENCQESEIHHTKDRHVAALANMKIARALITGVVERIGCDGPNMDNAYMVCPHMRTVIDSRNFVEGPNNPSLKLELPRTDISKPSTGQYI